MQSTRKWNGESAFAWLIVIVLHAVLWRELCKVEMVGFDSAANAPRLRMTWIPRAPAALPKVTSASSPAEYRRPQMRPKAMSDKASPLPDKTRVERDTTPQPVRPLSAVFLQQGRRHAERLARSEQAPVDPFASRIGGWQAPAADSIRMKRRISPKDVVAAVGQFLLAPPGYEQDPCHQNQRNIRRLMTDPDPQAMQRELDEERRYCRP